MDDEEAAHAYGRLVMWCQLHNTPGVQQRSMIFDPSKYAGDVTWLQSVTQLALSDCLQDSQLLRILTHE